MEMDRFKEEDVVYFYKYLPFNTDSIKTITEGTIKFSNPLGFNDPFDGMPSFDISSIDNLDEIRPDIFRQSMKQIEKSPGKRLLKKAQLNRQMKKSLKERVMSGSFSNDLISNMGVLSLSKSPLNILMWSHYADFHKGFVLEFRIPLKTDDTHWKALAKSGMRLHPLPIIYSKSRPLISMGISGTHEEMQKHTNSLLFTKSKKWKYEEEYRVVTPEREPGIYPYEKAEILSSVLCGIKIGKNFKKMEEIISQVNTKENLDIKLFQVKPSDSQYSLYVPGHPRLSAEP